MLHYGEGIGDRCLDGESNPHVCNIQSVSSSVVEHLPLNGKYTFYSQQYSDVAVSEKHFTNSREIGVAALCVPYKEHVLTSLHTAAFHDAFYEHH